MLSVTICWFPNQTLWFNEFPVQDTGWEACLLLWLHTASCDAFSYIWHTHTIYKVLMRNGPTQCCRGTVDSHTSAAAGTWQKTWLSCSWRSDTYCVAHDQVRKVSLYLRAAQHKRYSAPLWDTLTSSEHLTPHPGTLTRRHPLVPPACFIRLSLPL